jgi:hypothetical protein
MNATEYLSKIDEKVQPRLVRAIHALLNAGRHTGEVTEALAAQQSFGKYDGCHPTAIRIIAIEECHKINRQVNSENREIAQAAVASLRGEFPDMAKYFHANFR